MFSACRSLDYPVYYGARCELTFSFSFAAFIGPARRKGIGSAAKSPAQAKTRLSHSSESADTCSETRDAETNKRSSLSHSVTQFKFAFRLFSMKIKIKWNFSLVWVFRIYCRSLRNQKQRHLKKGFFLVFSYRESAALLLPKERSRVLAGHNTRRAYHPKNRPPFFSLRLAIRIASRNDNFIRIAK